MSANEPRIALGLLHDAAVKAAAGHARTEYGTVAARKAYRRYIEANTRFVNALAKLFEGANAQS